MESGGHGRFYPRSEARWHSWSLWYHGNENADSPTAKHTRLNTAAHRVNKLDIIPNMGCLRDRFRNKQLLEEATSISFRYGRGKQQSPLTPSLRNGWAGITKVISGKVVNLLAHLFQQGYHSTNPSIHIARSAIPSVHKKVDGL